MKLKQQFITLLAIGLALALPLLTHAQTFTQDGVTYQVTSGENVNITGVDPNATSLIIRKNPVYNNTTYTTGKIENGKIVSANATTVKFQGAWALESNVSGTQFYNLTAVEKYEVEDANTTYGTDASGENRGQLRAGDDGILFMWHSDAEIHMLAYPCKKTDLTTYNVPANVTNIQASAFRNNTTLTTINLNKELTLIRNEAFAGCTNLTAINAYNYGESDTKYFETIDGVLFQKDTRRNGNIEKFFPSDATYHRTLVAYPTGKAGTSYQIPDGTQVLGRSCFYGSNLTDITFADASDLIEIKEFAFNHCHELVNFTIPENVQYIDMKYYDSPINPVGSGVQTGSGTYNGHSIVASEAMGSFNYCYKLILNVDERNPYFKVVNTGDDSNVLMSKDGTRLVRYNCTKTFPGYIVPRNVTWIDSYAFNDTKVKHVVLPSGLTDVSRNMFENATQLEFITIPPLVTNIRQDVFKGCTGLTQVFMMPETPPVLKNANVFGTSNPTIYTKPDGTFNGVASTIYTKYTTAANYPSSDRIKYDIPVTFNSGMATMCRDFAVLLGDGITAYNIPNSDGINISEAAELGLTKASLDSNGKFVPARTGDNYGDYCGVVLTSDNASGTYQISVEDFANHFDYRGIYGDGEGAYDDVSFTFPDRDLNNGSNGVVSGTHTIDGASVSGCTVAFNNIGGNKINGTTENYWKELNGKYYQKLSANSTKITITPTSGTLIVGDKVRVTMYGGPNGETGALRFGDNDSHIQTVTYNSDKEVVLEYTLQDGDISSNSITISRRQSGDGQTTTFVRNITIVSSKKTNITPRTLKQSQYIVGTPVEKNITVYEGTGDDRWTNFGLKSGKFQRVAADGMVKCNKAYLHLPNNNVPSKVPGSNEVSSSAKFTLVFKDFVEDEFDNTETTGIQEMNVEARKKADNGIVYNIQGHRVGDAAELQQGSLPKGLYILNGKKYIVK